MVPSSPPLFFHPPFLFRGCKFDLQLDPENPGNSQNHPETLPKKWHSFPIILGIKLGLSNRQVMAREQKAWQGPEPNVPLPKHQPGSSADSSAKNSLVLSLCPVSNVWTNQGRAELIQVGGQPPSTARIPRKVFPWRAF